jgi:hypothetical protein
MTETELARKLGVSRKCLWERRQRLGIPRRKTGVTSEAERYLSHVRVTHEDVKKLLPQLFHVTEAGAYGNETPAFLAFRNPTIRQPLVLLGFAKVGTAPAICLVQEQ